MENCKNYVDIRSQLIERNFVTIKTLNVQGPTFICSYLLRKIRDRYKVVCVKTFFDFRDFFSFDNKNKLKIYISYLNVFIVLGDPNNHSVRFFFYSLPVFFFLKPKSENPVDTRVVGVFFFNYPTTRCAVRIFIIQEISTR